MAKKFLILAVAVLVIFLLAIFNQWYPILKINGELVWAREYYRRLESFDVYRRQTEEQLDQDNAKKGILFSLIIDRIVIEELAGRNIDLKEAEARVSEAAASSKDNLEKAANNLYGLSIRDFKRLFLLPRSRQDILAEKLALEGKDFGKWLDEKLAASEIKIYFLPYRWEAGNLFEK